MSDVDISAYFTDFDNALRYVEAEWRTYTPLSQQYTDWNEMAIWLHTWLDTIIRLARAKRTVVNLKSSSPLLHDLKIDVSTHIVPTKEQATVLVDSFGRLAIYYAKQRNTFPTFSAEWTAFDVCYRKVHMLRDKVIDTQTREKVAVEEIQKQKMIVAGIEYDALHQTGFPDPTMADHERWINDIFNDINADNAWLGSNLSAENVKKYQERARLRIMSDWSAKQDVQRTAVAASLIVAALARANRMSESINIGWWRDQLRRKIDSAANWWWQGGDLYPDIASKAAALADAIIKTKPEKASQTTSSTTFTSSAKAKIPAWA